VVFPEQECSVQRRFQKLLVETPSVTLTRDLREKLRTVVEQLVNTLEILGFASVEFLVHRGTAYFMEVNGYIQPSHNATSLLTGLDLLREQVRIHSGGQLGMDKVHLEARGHVIAAYIAAEDPENNFAPSPGRVDRFEAPSFGEGVIIQSSIFSGALVSTNFDPMVAKVMVRDANRPAAITKMRIALDDMMVDGIRTNIPLMRAVIASEAFAKGKVDNTFIGSHEDRAELIDALRSEEDAEVASVIAALALHLDSNNQQILESAREKATNPAWGAAARVFNRKKMEY
jgi:acetyl/propionyl-CoA carboxylase alpha subunit